MFLSPELAIRITEVFWEFIGRALGLCRVRIQEFVSDTEGEERTNVRVVGRRGARFQVPGTNTALEVAGVPSTVEDVQLLEGRYSPLLV
ncbi:hypothetical protein C474_13964 [Halogeometricum pallidum JCM 14848]|uniref:Uncharacterized protein n=1 Tax=Halogeometricum pallidum JCM 14848 TaxID=1227487 RepID=M0D2H2_HALPD|nr:hypothetical protein C474_13964 [Halogeometricum pallidum JCM 14848]